MVQIAIMEYDDPFDQVDAVDQTHIQEGHAEGVEEGRRLGFQEGKDLGYVLVEEIPAKNSRGLCGREVKGWEIGAEIGFYYGCFLLWRETLKTHLSQIPSKAEKSILSLGKLIEAYKLVVRCGCSHRSSSCG
ncbi:hypothetical protein AC1031_018635 [Aphanomyces cochlioides]|nr:hypothetical protein AC1031_018635 [Aphanomyces cochlioides]